MTELLDKDLVKSLNVNEVISTIQAGTSQNGGNNQSETPQLGGGIKNTYAELSTIGMNLSDSEDEEMSVQSNMNTLQLINKINNLIQKGGQKLSEHDTSDSEYSDGGGLPTLNMNDDSSSSESETNMKGGDGEEDNENNQQGGMDEEAQEMLSLENKLQMEGGANPVFMKMLSIRKLLSETFGKNGIYVMVVASKLAKKFDPNKNKSESELLNEVKKYVSSNKSTVENMLKDAEKEIADKRNSKKK